jgi:hypothetical protein
MDNEHTLLLLQALAYKEQGVDIVLCDADTADTYTGACALKKLENPSFGIYGDLRSKYSQPQLVPRTEFITSRGNYNYICYGCRESLVEHE